MTVKLAGFKILKLKNCKITTKKADINSEDILTKFSMVVVSLKTKIKYKTNEKHFAIFLSFSFNKDLRQGFIVVK